MKREHRVLDFIASWLNVFDVDWDSDFESDGYTDTFGRDVDEPFFMLDEAEQQEPVEDIGGRIHIAQVDCFAGIIYNLEYWSDTNTKQYI